MAEQLCLQVNVAQLIQSWRVRFLNSPWDPQGQVCTVSLPALTSHTHARPHIPARPTCQPARLFAESPVAALAPCTPRTAHASSRLHRFPCPETLAREKYYRLHKLVILAANDPSGPANSDTALCLGEQCPIEEWRGRLWQYCLAEQGAPDVRELGPRLQQAFNSARLAAFQLQPGVRVSSGKAICTAGFSLALTSQDGSRSSTALGWPPSSCSLACR